MEYKVLNKLNDHINEELKTYPELTKILLANREIKTAKEAEIFLNPVYTEHLHNPFLMRDMKKAVERILKAIKENEKILIYSDYDMDGIPGAVALHDFFKKIGYQNFLNYIPHRTKEGFGLNIRAIEKMADEGINLIITIDCGISDAKEVELANKKGIDTIITDHHLPNGVIPEAYAILNPKQKEDEYPFKELAGAGVVFKLIQALITNLEVSPLSRGETSITKGWEKWLLDMVGMATIADRVPLNGENRVLAYYGIMVLRKSPRLGLIRLLRRIKVEQNLITEDDVGFMIGPRINAASRMDVPDEAFKLLVTKNEVEADKLAEHLNNINNQRKGFVASIIKEARRKVKNEKPIIVIGNPEWNPGLVGLACSNLVDEYKKPVFLWGRGDSSEIKGSCRSDGSVNVVELMSKVPKNILTEFGGHSMSGGFSIRNRNTYLFEEEMMKAYEKTNKKEILNNETVYLDKEIEIDDINFNNYSQIEKLAPFGEANPKPIFLFRDALIEETTLFGKRKEHLKLKFKKTNGETVEAISFFADKSDFLDKAIKDKEINLIANIEMSYFMNNGKLRLRIIDII